MSIDDRLTELLLRWEELREQGQAPTPEELCRHCPELLGPFREAIHALDGLHPLLDTVASPPGPAAPSASTGGPARYHPVALHARGGLGEVYRALDAETGREVALKEIQPRYADHPESRARFLREGRVTALLEHPGIVPVYGLGAHGNGRPYYAMRFLRGESLADAIGRYHREPSQLVLRQLLARFVAVCHAVAYAHSRGVIHRDLKPSNVMLGEFGEAYVVDWGLARVGRGLEGKGPLADHFPVSGPAETRLGHALGTPAFMPPEQARGELAQVNEQSDIFALGATLYCLLTGQPPYSGEDQLAQAERGEVEPARRRRRDVPPPLEAVCARALAREPERRYASARELGEEVERFLADEPVRAYREPLAQRLRRWAKRHRTLVTSAGVLLAASVLALAAGLFAVGREKDRTAQALDQANRHLREAEDNLQLARQAVEECFLVARNDPRLQGEGQAEVRRLLYAKARPFYRAFRDRRPEDPTLRAQTAEQLLRWADIEEELGSPDEAVAAARHAAELLQALTIAYPAQPEYRKELVQALRLHGGLLAKQRREEGLVILRQARRLASDALASRPGWAWMQDQLAAIANSIGVALAQVGDHDAAMEHYLQARALYSALTVAYPNDRRVRSELGDVNRHLGIQLSRAGRVEEALRLYQQAAHMAAALVEAAPSAATYRGDLADALIVQGEALQKLGRLDAARRALERARQTSIGLANAYPNVATYRRRLSVALSHLGDVQAALGERAEALRSYDQAQRLLVRLVVLHPDVIDYQVSLAAVCSDRARLLHAAGRREEAREAFEQARRLFRRLATDHPQQPLYTGNLARASVNVGAVYNDLGRTAEALAAFDEARARYAELMKRPSPLPSYANGLANAQLNRGQLLQRLGRDAEALEALRQAHELRTRLVRDHRGVPEYRADLARVAGSLGNALKALDHDDEARKAFDQSIALYRELRAAAPAVGEHASGLAEALVNRGALGTKRRQPAEAIRDYVEAQALYRRLIDASPDQVGHRQALATALNNHGNALFARKQPREALARFDEARALQAALVKAHPEVPRYRRDLARSIKNRARMLGALGQPKEAITALREARDLQAALLKGAPTVPSSWVDVITTEYNLGLLLAEDKQPDASRTAYAEVVRLVDAMEKQGLRDALARQLRAYALVLRADSFARASRYREALPELDRAAALSTGDVRWSALLGRVSLLLRLGELARAEAEATDLLAIKGLSVNQRFQLARSFGAITRLAGQDPRAPLPVRERLGEAAARRAVAVLDQLAAGGAFRSPTARVTLDKEKDLEVLRGRPDYRALRARMEDK